MRINPIYKTINFQATYRRVKNENNGLKHSNYTCFFRDDLSWKNFAAYIDKRFENEKHVDVYSIGCSDGSEALSLAMLLKNSSKNPEKFFPIKGFDYDDYIVKRAKNGVYNLALYEAFDIKKLMESDWEEYFDIKNGTINTVKPKDSLRNCVRFECKNALDVLDEIPEKGAKIIMARNFWPYLNKTDVDKLLSKIDEKTDKGSLFVIGSFDFNQLTVSPKSLAKHDFAQAKSIGILSPGSYVYEKL